MLRTKTGRFGFSSSDAIPLGLFGLLLVLLPFSGGSFSFLVQEFVLRASRSFLLVVSLYLPLKAGLGVNYAFALGLAVGEASLLAALFFGVSGKLGFLFALTLALPLSIVLGLLAAKVLARTREKGNLPLLAFTVFLLALAEFAAAFVPATFLPAGGRLLVLPRGYGLKPSIDLGGLYGALDNLLLLRLGSFALPAATLGCAAFLAFAAYGLFLVFEGRKEAAPEAHSLAVVVLSLVLAGLGTVLGLQSSGVLIPAGAYAPTALFTLAALFAGGVTAERAGLPRLFLGLVLFHLVYVLSPLAAKGLAGSAMLGDSFRLFVAALVVLIALVREKDEKP